QQMPNLRRSLPRMNVNGRRDQRQSLHPTGKDPECESTSCSRTSREAALESSITMATEIPPDDLNRNLTVARPAEAKSLPHIALAGDTYTILLTGNNTVGRYCLIDMLVPPGGG